MNNGEYSHISRELGVDPSDGKMLVAKFGQFGAYVQKGDGEDKQYASLGKGQLIETLTLEDALKLFQLPRTVGEYEGVPVVAMKGRYGPYLKYGDTNVSLPRGKDPLKISLEECAALISGFRKKGTAPSVMKEFAGSGISVMNGLYGPYLKKDGANYKLPKGTDAAALTEEECLKIISGSAPTERGRSRRRFKK